MFKLNTERPSPVTRTVCGYWFDILLNINYRLIDETAIDELD